MSFHTYASAIIGAQKNYERKPADFYPTPADVTVALMEHLRLPKGTVAWEPACGEGHMSRVLEHYLGDDRVWSSDLRTDNVYGEKEIDFLTCPVNTEIDWIITNPPFKLAHLFISRALAIAPNAAFLLKSQYWHAKSRLKLFRDHPPAELLPLTWRPAFLERERGRSPLMDVMWVVWKRGENSSVFQPLQRPGADFIHARFGLPDNAPMDQSENIGLYSFDDLLGDAREASDKKETKKDEFLVDDFIESTAGGGSVRSNDAVVSGVGTDFSDLLV